MCCSPKWSTMADGIGKPMAIKPLEFVRRCRRPNSSTRSWELAGLEAHLTDAWAKDQATHSVNLVAIEHNKEMRGRITALMAEAGVPDHYYAPKAGSRSSRWPPKNVKHEAGYLGDLRRTFPISDGFEEVKRLHDSIAKEIADTRAVAEKASAAAAEAIKKNAERRKAELVLAAIKVRHGIADDVDWDGTLEALRSKDKYLDLAIAGLWTRGDWSDGFHRVEAALKRFTIESNQDKDIAADLCGCMGSDDGRVFRDTTWSYDKLFDLVADKTLLADARTCLENVRDA